MQMYLFVVRIDSRLEDFSCVVSVRDNLNKSGSQAYTQNQAVGILFL
jgi:hypothetical protein